MPSDPLSATFAALADPTRRAILARLAAGEASVKELAEPFAMTLPAVTKHLKVLQRAGLITQGRRGPVAALPPRRQAASARSRIGSSSTAGSGTRVSTGWTTISRNSKNGRRRMTAANRESGAVAEPPRDRRRRPTESWSPPASSTRLARLVFRAWTDPGRIGRWWGPRGFTTTTYAMDVRPGRRLAVLHARPRRRRLSRTRSPTSRSPSPRGSSTSTAGTSTASRSTSEATVTFEDRRRQDPAHDADDLPDGRGARLRRREVRGRPGPGQTIDRLGEYAAERGRAGRKP